MDLIKHHWTEKTDLADRIHLFKTSFLLKLNTERNLRPVKYTRVNCCQFQKWQRVFPEDLQKPRSVVLRLLRTGWSGKNWPTRDCAPKNTSDWKFEWRTRPTDKRLRRRIRQLARRVKTGECVFLPSAGLYWWPRPVPFACGAQIRIDTRPSSKIAPGFEKWSALTVQTSSRAFHKQNLFCWRAKILPEKKNGKHLKTVSN